MSYDEYWNQSPFLAKIYRAADRIKRDRINEQLWLQGLYIYEALLDVSPVLRASLGKTAAKPIDYRSRPYPLTRAAIREEERRAQNQKVEKMLEMFNAISESNKAKEQQRKEASEHGDDAN